MMVQQMTTTEARHLIVETNGIRMHIAHAGAPLRRISVRESLKAPGWANWITLLSDTTYHSLIGEVEALNTTTIRRLTPSCRHQLLAIAGLAFQ
jgi:hypothetical protein